MTEQIQTRENFTSTECLETLRELMQDEMDPTTDGGRGYDAELGKDDFLRLELGVDSPQKALNLLKEAIAKGYEPFGKNQAEFSQADATNTWSSHLSGVVEGEAGVGSVLADPGEPEDETGRWIAVIQDMIDAHQMPDLTELAQRQYAESFDTFWTQRLNSLTIQSVKLAAKRALSDKIPGIRNYGFHSEDDKTMHGSSETEGLSHDQRAKKAGRGALRFFRKS